MYTGDTIAMAMLAHYLYPMYIFLLSTLLTRCHGQPAPCPDEWPEGQKLGVPSYFYPFGSSVDTVMHPEDDGNSPRLSLSSPYTPLPFYGQIFTYMYVSTNGALYFADPPDWFPIGGMPLQNLPLVGPMFLDTDPSMSDGRAYYRATTEENVLCRVSNYIREKRLDALKFKATWAFIATWHNLTWWRGNSSDPVNTFQSVVATDGYNSFALFNYGNITWSIAPGIIHAQVGFNSGIGDNHFVIPGSQTAAMEQLDDVPGNTRDIGRWLFRINGESINGYGSEGISAVHVVREKTSVTFSCPSASSYPTYTSRFWLRRDDPDDLDQRTVLFSQHFDNQMANNEASEGIVVDHAPNRADMELNADSFELTVGQVALRDDAYFTCELVHGTPQRKVLDNIHIQVYIEPEIQLTGVEDDHIANNQTITVTCTIHRLYPPIDKPGSFQLVWGTLHTEDQVLSEQYKSARNADGSYKYTITRTRQVTLHDSGTLVTCTVLPVRGSQSGNKVSVSRKLSVIPSVTDIRQLDPDESAPRAETVKLAAIVGGVAGGVVLLFVLLILIIICRKTKDQTDQKESTETPTEGGQDNSAFRERLPSQPNTYVRESHSTRLTANNERSPTRERLPPMIPHPPYDVVTPHTDPIADKIQEVASVVLRHNLNMLFALILHTITNKGKIPRPPIHRPISDPNAEHFYEEIGTSQKTKDEEDHYLKPVAAYDDWLKHNNISTETIKALQKHGLTTVDDLRKLREDDLKDLQLIVGERIRLKKAIATLNH